MSFDLTWGEEGPVNHSDHRAIGLAVLDACRDAANGWVFPESGPPCPTIRDAFVSSVGNPTHFVDVTDIDRRGYRVAARAPRLHRRPRQGLRPDEFLRNMAGYIGLGTG